MPALSMLVAGASEHYLTPQRAWLDGLALIVPASGATRWLLVADLGCLIAIGLATRRPGLGLPLALGAGFLVLNALGMALTDFYLGLAFFHLLVGIAAAMFAGAARWVGFAALALALALGILT
jgi:hypothetical protein